MANGSAPISDREQRVALARRARFMKCLLWSAAAVAVFAGGAYAVVRYSGEQAQNRPGVFFANQGQQHVPIGTPFAYNSNPPTSGPHYARPEEWGVYQKEIHDQVLIHNLEHGGIWISYRPGVASSTIAELEAITREFGRKVIMTPRSANDPDVALAAWNWLDKFSAAEFSEERVRAFIKTHRNRGPEFVP